jgi:hypothetical protein
MAKANAATKRAPRLVDLGAPQRIEFSPDGISYLSGLLEIGARLPVKRWADSRPVVKIDAAEKRDLLSRIHEATLGLTQTVKLIGLLMAGEGKNGYLEYDPSVHLGFALNGLADLTEQLVRVQEELADAEPVGGSHG